MIINRVFKKLVSRLDWHEQCAERHVSNEDLRLLANVKEALLPLACSPVDNYCPRHRLGHAGFGINDEKQRVLLESFLSEPVQALFKKLRASDAINTGHLGVDYRAKGLIHNGYYPSPDAEIYGAMIHSFKPCRIVEVGSGYSTVIARMAVQHAGLDCPIHVIDPMPRRDISQVADHVELTPVETSSLDLAILPPGSLLFIDSSHVCRSLGDVPFLFCNVLPALPAGVLVHVHDIFIPYDYPDNYYERFYTEQYMLHALLANSSKYEVVLATHYMSRTSSALMQSVFGPCVGADPLFLGASFWMRSIA